MPAAAYLEMAAAAVREFLGEPTVFLEDIRFHHLLFLPDEQPVPTCVRLDPSAGSFQILSARPDAPSQWEVQAEGLYRSGRLHVPPRRRSRPPPRALQEERDPQALYRDLAGIGQVYGPTFQNHRVTAAARGGIGAREDRHVRPIAAGRITSCFRRRSTAAFTPASRSDAGRIAARSSSCRCASCGSSGRFRRRSGAISGSSSIASSHISAT